MAKMLKTTKIQLKKLIETMSKEERFSKMKQFYLKMYPQSKSFYENFGKQKRTIDELNEDEDDSSLNGENIEKKIKSNNGIEIIKSQKEAKVDYYENMSTFENVLDLIECSSTSTLSTASHASQEEQDAFNKFQNLLKNDGSIKPAQNSAAKNACLNGKAGSVQDEVDEIFQKFIKNENSSVKASKFKCYVSPRKSLGEKKLEEATVVDDSPKKQVAKMVEKPDQYWDMILDDVLPKLEHKT